MNGRYVEEAGNDHEAAGRLMKERGSAAASRYRKPVEAHARERGLADHPNPVRAVEATRSMDEDGTLLVRARRAPDPYPAVVLLPRPEPEESLRILRERARLEVSGVDRTRHPITHRSNKDLAKFTVSTEGRTPEETADPEQLSRA